MGRFSEQDAENYGNSNNSSFFTLKNDKDTARVRFMYNSMQDVFGYAVHEIQLGDKRRYVNCLRDYTDPKDVCPLCAAGNVQKAKVYVPLYDVDEQAVKIWERGKKYLSSLSSLCSRYSSADTPLVSHVFEIERNGKPKDTQTTYREFEIKKDDTTLADLPEVPEVLGSIVLDKSADELRYFLEHREFPEGSQLTSRRDERYPEANGDYTPRRTPSRRDEGMPF